MKKANVEPNQMRRAFIAGYMAAYAEMNKKADYTEQQIEYIKDRVFDGAQRSPHSSPFPVHVEVSNGYPFLSLNGTLVDEDGAQFLRDVLFDYVAGM